MTAPTPRGLLRTYVSMSRLTSSLSPTISFGNAHKLSTTCRPRPTSPRASAYVLPCSRTMLRARSGKWCLMRCWYLSRICCRCSNDVRDHDLNASCAVCAACSSSLGVD